MATKANPGEKEIFKQAFSKVLDGLATKVYKKSELDTLVHSLGEAFKNLEPEAEPVTDVELHAMYGKKPLHISSEFMRDSLPAFNVKSAGKENARESYRSLISPDLSKIKGLAGTPERMLPRRMSMMSDANIEQMGEMAAADEKVLQLRRASLPINDVLFESPGGPDDDDDDEDYIGQVQVIKASEVENPPANSVEKDENQNNSFVEKLSDPNLEPDLQGNSGNPVHVTVNNSCNISETQNPEPEICDEEGRGDLQFVEKHQGDSLTTSRFIEPDLDPESATLPPASVTLNESEEREDAEGGNELDGCYALSPSDTDRSGNDPEVGTPTESLDSSRENKQCESVPNISEGVNDLRESSSEPNRLSRSKKARSTAAKAVAVKKVQTKKSSSKLTPLERSSFKGSVSELAMKYYKSMTAAVKSSKTRKTQIVRAKSSGRERKELQKKTPKSPDRILKTMRNTTAMATKSIQHRSKSKSDACQTRTLTKENKVKAAVATTYLP